MNHCWAYKQRIRAEREAAEQQQRIEVASRETLEETARDYQQFQLLLASLETDLKRLSQHPKGEPRNDIKRAELLPRYMPYVTEYLESGEAFNNPVLVNVVIWLFDTGQIDQAIKLGFQAAGQKQAMPERFNRGIHTFIADAVLEWSTLQKARGYAVEPYFSRVFQRLLDDEWPVPDVVKSKYHKQAGDLALETGQLQQALVLFVRATELDPRGAQCKTRIKNIREKLERARPAADSRPDDSTTATGTPAGGEPIDDPVTPESRGAPVLLHADGEFKL